MASSFPSFDLAGSSLKSGKRRDPFVKVGETDRQGIHVWMFFHQGEGDVFGLFPGKRSHYEQC